MSSGCRAALSVLLVAQKCRQFLIFIINTGYRGVWDFLLQSINQSFLMCIKLTHNNNTALRSRSNHLSVLTGKQHTKRLDTFTYLLFQTPHHGVACINIRLTISEALLLFYHHFLDTASFAAEVTVPLVLQCRLRGWALIVHSYYVK